MFAFIHHHGVDLSSMSLFHLLFAVWITVASTTADTNHTIISQPTSTTTNVSIFDASDYNGTLAGNTIDCGTIENCYVLCYETRICESVNISASLTTNLVLECMAKTACKSINVLSPGPSSTFNMTCNGTNSCSAANIELVGTDHIDIDCGAYSCRQTDLVLNSITSVAVECGFEGCYNSRYAVTDASDATFGCSPSQIDRCFGSISDPAEFYFENAGNITFDASDSTQAFLGAHVDLVSSNTSNVTGSFSAICPDYASCRLMNVDALHYHSRYRLTVE